MNKNMFLECGRT